MAREHLIQRGKQHYLRLAIPRPIRHLFPSGKGQPRDYIVEPLGRNYDPARVEADRRVADYRVLFSRAALMTVEAVQAEIEAIKRSAEGRRTVADLPMLQSELERVRQEYRERVERLDPGDAIKAANDAYVAAIKAEHRRDIAKGVRRIAPDIAEGSEAWNDLADRVLKEHYRAWNEAREAREARGVNQTPIPAAPNRETITQAAEAWYSEMQRTAVRPQTLDGHRLRVRAFVERCGDVPLASVTRAMASDFLTAISSGRSNRTTNNYAQTMLALFKNARNRGRVSGENPFEDQRRKVAAEKREAFNSEELQKIFRALPVEVAPKKHSPETALPWAVRIAAYTGMRLEEIAQLTVADVQTRGANGGTVIVFDIHNGDADHHLKNDGSARAVPVHSELVRAGFLDYGQALPQDGLLFPGLTRRESKGGKIGARLGELFRKKLIRLGMKREGLCFHSLRHSVAQRLEAAAVSQTDAARVLGHAIAGESYGTYSSGPGLKRLAAVVEEIRYD